MHAGDARGLARKGDGIGSERKNVRNDDALGVIGHLHLVAVVVRDGPRRGERRREREENAGKTSDSGTHDAFLPLCFLTERTREDGQ